MQFQKFSTEMHCTIFVSCIFVIFFTSSAISVANASTIGSGDSGNSYNQYEVYHPESPSLSDNSMEMPSYGGSPVIGGPSDTPEPHISGPNDNPPMGIQAWWEPIATFFQSLLEHIGF